MILFCNPWNTATTDKSINQDNDILCLSTATTATEKGPRKSHRQQQEEIYREDFVLVKLQELVDCRTKRQAETIMNEIDSCISEELGDEKDSFEGSADNHSSGRLLDILDSVGAVYFIHDLLHNPENEYRRPAESSATPLLCKLLTRYELLGKDSMQSFTNSAPSIIPEEKLTTTIAEPTLEVSCMDVSDKQDRVPEIPITEPQILQEVEESACPARGSTNPNISTTSTKATTTKKNHRGSSALASSVSVSKPQITKASPSYRLPNMTNNRSVL